MLHGADTIDANMLRDALTPIVMGALRANGTESNAIRAANELAVVPFGADTKAMIQGKARASTRSSPSLVPIRL